MGIPILLVGALVLVLVAVMARGMRGAARSGNSTPQQAGDDGGWLARLAAGGDGGACVDAGVDAGCDGGADGGGGGCD